VVGVIVNLALFFGYHTLWPQGFSGSVDIASAIIAAGAAIALLKFKRNVMQVIGVCGLIGIGLQLAMK
jgi:chromate transporter